LYCSGGSSSSTAKAGFTIKTFLTHGTANKNAQDVKQRYEELLKDKQQQLDKTALKRAFIERYYQLEDLDLSDENQHKFITENWKGTLYAPTGKQQHYRIYVLDAEIAIRDTHTAENLQKLAQFKMVK